MIKLFTHTDLDGVSCAILAFEVWGKDSVDVEYCSYTNIDDNIKKFLDNGDIGKYSDIFITDISMNSETASLLSEKIKETGCQLTLLDHHKTAEHLNDYDWALVTTNHPIGEDRKTCGVDLFLNAILMLDENNTAIEKSKIEKIKDYIEIVRKYDTWEWSKLGDEIPKKFNELFFILGKDKFISNILFKFTYFQTMELDTFDNTLLEIEDDKRHVYIKLKQKTVKVITLYGYTAGVVFAESYISELGNTICKENENLDLACIISGGTVNLRSVKENVDVSAIAKTYGGGGHPAAAGFPLTARILDSIVNIVFNLKD